MIETNIDADFAVRNLQIEIYNGIAKTIFITNLIFKQLFILKIQIHWKTL